MGNQKASQKPNNGDKSAAIHILVIDDEPTLRTLLERELTKNGYRVTTAVNGLDALSKINQGQFQLIISDVIMPELGGLELLEAVKKQDPDIEVIMATGFGTIETAVMAMKKGAYDFVQKPFNMQEILVLIEKALEKRELKTLLGVYDASKAVFSSIKLETLLPIIMKLTLKILKADDASLLLSGPDGKLSLAASSGLQDNQRSQSRLLLGERAIMRAGGKREPLLIQGRLEDDSRFSDLQELSDIRSALLQPLTLEGEPLGVLNVNRTKETKSFTSSDLCTITILGAQIAQAVYNANLYEKLEAKMNELKDAYKKLEETQVQLVQTEKLAAIGELAAGVAHELNNPLTGILGFSQMILESEDLPKQIKEDVESIHAQSQRCRKIIQNLLQFSRRKKSQKEPVELTGLLSSALQLVKYDLNTSGIDVDTKFPVSSVFVFGDPSELQQVFLNIIMNARHALEDRRPARLSIGLRVEGGKALLEFADTGCGMPKEALKKVFDPFFTTKPVGKGMGLGLSTSYGILKQHQGEIRVESREGVGSTITIALPLHEPENYESQKNTDR